jgi:hypothetical protein
VSGYADEQGNALGLFKPDNFVTYAELAKMAILATGKALPEHPSGHIAGSSPYIEEAKSLGLSVYGPSLSAHTPATRAAAIQTLLEAFSIPLVMARHSPFSDLSILHPGAQAIIAARNLGIIEGDRARDGSLMNTVRPDGPVTRAEIAKIIHLLRVLRG